MFSWPLLGYIIRVTKLLTSRNTVFDSWVPQETSRMCHFIQVGNKTRDCLGMSLLPFSPKYRRAICLFSNRAVYAEEFHLHWRQLKKTRWKLKMCSPDFLTGTGKCTANPPTVMPLLSLLDWSPSMSFTYSFNQNEQDRSRSYESGWVNRKLMAHSTPQKAAQPKITPGGKTHRRRNNELPEEDQAAYN